MENPFVNYPLSNSFKNPCHYNDAGCALILLNNFITNFKRKYLSYGFVKMKLIYFMYEKYVLM